MIFINNLILKYVNNLTLEKHRKLYNFTRTKYGKKFYEKQNTDNEIEFTKCYWFPVIALEYLKRTFKSSFTKDKYNL